ncbi:hypothetical protein BaRGS_00017304 [Batillaria attramentaria]|uniref:Leucine-rich repeat-containing protein 72 n=1 Tax=Batillaria attramentaria TaxID=370345 RepID=A0ABD0KWP0_9CAEN
MAASERALQVRFTDCMSEQVVEEILAKRRIKKDKEVEELYLAERGLRDVHDLRRFRYLKKLWLNGNKLRRIACLSINFRLSELYLQDNELTEITGAIGHLTCLQVLMLHNNQLTKLDKVTREFQKMQNLFDNPIAQEPEYRLFVIQSVRSVKLLDRQEVSKREKDIARRIYDHSQEKVREKIAFGRRSQGPPSLYYPGTPGRPTTVRGATSKEVANNYLKNKPVFDDPEEAVNSRRLKKSLTMYSSFDWGKVPRIQERRTSEQVFGNPEIITRVYR